MYRGLPYIVTIYWHYHNYHEKHKTAFIDFRSCRYIQYYLCTFSITVSVIILTTGTGHKQPFKQFQQNPFIPLSY